MKELKKKVIALLEENARYTFSDLAAMTGEDENAVKTAVSELEKAGAIVKYTAIVNEEKLGRKSVQALIEVKVAPQKLNGFDSYAEELYNFPEVRSLYLMSGGFDLAVFIDGESLGDIAKFVAEKLSIIDGITSVATHFILKKYKIEGNICNNNEEQKRQIVHA